jgi:murein DD-endopeptidase MepM/ murein hydrolase activator NlpD
VRKAAPIILAILFLSSSVAAAQVTQDELNEARSEVAKVSAELEDELVLLDEAIYGQRNYEGRIAAIEDEIRRRDREVALAAIAAKERAVALYLNAGTSRFQSLLGVDRFSNVGTRTAYLDALVDEDRDAITELEFLQADRGRLQEELDGLLGQQRIVRADLEASSTVILTELQQATDEYQALYDQWWEEELERRRIAEERRRAEEERRRREAASAAAAAAAASNYTTSAAAPTSGRVCPFTTPVAFRDSWGEPRPGGRSHTGVDMVAPLGVPLVAIESGYIWSPNWHYAGGNGLYLRGDSGDVYYYAHLAGYADGIQGGTRVSVGQVIGYNGDTGNAAVPHLHLGYQPGGGRLTNPYQLMVKLCR